MTCGAAANPKKKAVVVLYGSMYGNTASAANALAAKVAAKGVKVAVHDLSCIDNSEAVAECWRASTVVLAAPTYNGGIYLPAANLLEDLKALNLRPHLCPGGKRQLGPDVRQADGRQNRRAEKLHRAGCQGNGARPPDRHPGCRTGSLRRRGCRQHVKISPFPETINHKYKSHAAVGFPQSGMAFVECWVCFLLFFAGLRLQWFECFRQAIGTQHVFHHINVSQKQPARHPQNLSGQLGFKGGHKGYPSPVQCAVWTRASGPCPPRNP